MRWLAVLAALLAFSVHSQEIPDWFSPSFLDIREDVAEAAKQGKRVMIYFHQDGCPYCKQLVTVNFRDPKIVAAMRRDFVAIDVNIFGSREVTWTDGRRMPEKELAALLKIQFTPTLVFLDEKAALAHRINGYLPPDRFLPALDAARRAARSGGA
jgi:thioredoxin-related protein